MLIVCPSCASEYMIDPGRLGADGRNVRCAGCKETWFVAPEVNEVPEPDEPAAAPVIEESADVPSDGDVAEAEEPSPALASEAVDKPPYPSTEAEEEGLNAMARAAPARGGSSSRRFAAAGPLLLVAALAATGSLVWGRTHIVRAYPPTAALYARVGLPVNLRGLEFRAVRSELVADGTDTFLVIEGEIANISGRDAPVPPIEIGVRGAEGHMLYTWTNDPPRPTLTTSDTAQFTARLAAPPAEARQVLVRFAAGRDGAAVASRTP
jgi:predicted Zn finger-like uncharacterized protein